MPRPAARLSAAGTSSCSLRSHLAPGYWGARLDRPPGALTQSPPATGSVASSGSGSRTAPAGAAGAVPAMPMSTRSASAPGRGRIAPGPGRRVARLDEHATILGDDLGGAAHARADDRKPRVQGLDECDPERLRPGVRLAVHVGRRQQPGHVGSLAEETNPVGDAPRRGSGLQLPEVDKFVRPLGTTG